MNTHNATERIAVRVAAIVADVLTAHPLPAMPAGLSPADRLRLEADAHTRGITPEALLSIRRAEQSREVTEARELAALGV